MPLSNGLQVTEKTEIADDDREVSRDMEGQQTPMFGFERGCQEVSEHEHVDGVWICQPIGIEQVLFSGMSA